MNIHYIYSTFPCGAQRGQCKRSLAEGMQEPEEIRAAPSPRLPPAHGAQGRQPHSDTRPDAERRKAVVSCIKNPPPNPPHAHTSTRSACKLANSTEKILQSKNDLVPDPDVMKRRKY